VTTSSLYDRVGGESFFFDLVDRFYDGVATDPLLRPMYPDDLGDSRRHLALFLMQYWGGPTTYSEERGHPRLRRRHAPHVVDVAARDAWLRHMRAALSSMELDDADRDALTGYLETTANQLRNA
jgi:hemoglobin